MSQQKRPDQGDATDSRAQIRKNLAQIMLGPAAYTNLNDIQNIQNPFPPGRFGTGHRTDNPDNAWQIFSYRKNGVEYWVTFHWEMRSGLQVTSEQQIQQQNWQRQLSDRAQQWQWPIIEDAVRKSDKFDKDWWNDPNYIAWCEATKDKIFPPHTSTLAPSSNSFTTSHSGSGTYTAGSQYSGGAQYPGGESSNSGGASYNTGGAQYSGGGSSNSGGASYNTGDGQYSGGRSSNSGGASYNTGEGQYSDEPARTPGYYDPTTDSSAGGQPRQNPSSRTSGRGAGYSGRHRHRENPY
ncbi:hypothetical protein BGAL_0284g00120 [Botrytis galanthina]|uniref:Uncharacterized protein n=1 Tax=Botrytis galanthina TaxID=278940 RepID=A0A4S8QS17_9HELO|nr:hypothetical protein BGAL_0284g00120 [Botrytis galanthina]